MVIMSSKKERSLTALYREMPTSEIERRLTDPDIADLARSVAAEELVRREAEPALATLSTAERHRDTRPSDGLRIAMFVAGIAVFSALAWMLLRKELAGLLILGISLPAAAALIGKAVPGPAQIVGWILLATPLWLGATMWYRGELAWKSGDFRPLETIIMWGLLGVLSLVGMGVGGSLVAGARHKGTWEDLTDELEQEKKDAVDTARHLG